ncbi:TonB-dependent receptor [Chryseobacterium paridis]|uniref:TonB-dependent receptor n=1 Tax=Chryseobacterium paridis TaxID=2800328 RepID=A0ABS1FPX7_9FLAO|nr:TonB-dependent receptor [Chryseobacterium paridis]MBK1894465.1 TonB-dependent receptor [Chryseobacterium paridis]
MKLINKSMLTAIITLSTASVYYAQQVQDTVKDTRSKDIEQVVLTGVADIAKDRKTPVAVSTIKEAQIVQRLGNQEFPEILSTTPSIYATKGGGGFGDGRMNVRGFDTSNTAVMINGVPVNDMEGGSVYWSNWAGLSDVTSAMQIQRGLGASKLAIASVGGTVNIITRSADKKREGNVTLGVGNDGYLKTLFSYNTGKSAKGWSTSFLMSRTAGAMYIDGSDFEAYNYYFALGFQPNKKHDFQFTFTGAPQWHNQTFNNSIATDLDMGDGKLDGVLSDKPNRKYNSNWGYLNGQQYSQTVNYYSKPVASINWDWNISEKSKLSTVGYASWGRGGGTGILGSINGKGINALPKSTDGLIRFDDIYAWNTGQTVADFGANNKTPFVGTSSNGITRRASVNSHDWYGILSNFQHKVNDNWNFSVGIDARYYYGYHPGLVTDFLGNTEYREAGNFNQYPYYTVTQSYNATPSANPFAAAVKDKSQIVYRNYDGKVLWGGVFGQLEYTNDKISAFVQGSASEQSNQRIDKWVWDGTSTVPTGISTTQQGQVVNQKTEQKFRFGYNAKAGVNYNINEQHNVFVNVGIYSKQPNQNAIFPYNLPTKTFGSLYQQIENKDIRNEQVTSAEIGYGFKSGKFRANLNGYYTDWKDRFVRVLGITYTNPDNTTGTNGTASLTGVREVHMGVELETFYKPLNWLEFNGMLSIGNWKYKNNPTGRIADVNGDPISTNGKDEVVLALDGMKVGDAAQTTAAIGATVKPVKNLDVFATWRYYDNLYGTFSINSSYIITTPGVTPSGAQNGSLKAPSYNLTDVGASYTFNLKNGNRLIITGNVYNVFDTTYISDLRSSIFVNDKSKGVYKGLDTANSVYFGFGRTWAASLSYRF